KPGTEAGVMNQAGAARPSSIKRAIVDHPIGAFLIILYPVSWILFLPAVLGKSGIGVLSIDIPAQASILLVTIIGLTGTAFLVTRLADGRSGTRALRRSYVKVKAGVLWYFLALFGAPILLLVVALVVRGTGALNRLRPTCLANSNRILSEPDCDRDPDLCLGGGRLDRIPHLPSP